MSVGLNRDGTGIVSLDQLALIRGLYSRIGSLWKSRACRTDGVVACAGKAGSFLAIGVVGFRAGWWLFSRSRRARSQTARGPVEKPAWCALRLVRCQWSASLIAFRRQVSDDPQATLPAQRTRVAVERRLVLAIGDRLRE